MLVQRAFAAKPGPMSLAAGAGAYVGVCCPRRWFIDRPDANEIGRTSQHDGLAVKLVAPLDDVLVLLCSASSDVTTLPGAGFGGWH